MERRTGTRGDALSQGSHTLCVDGVDQCYHVFGHGPICVVHSGGPGIQWSYVRMPLLERRLTMVYVEPIGTGASGRLPDHPRGYSIARYGRQLGEFLAALDLSGILLLGHSHGGFVAQDHALAHPERLRGLVLYSTSAVADKAFWAAGGDQVEAFARRNAASGEAQNVLAAWRAMPTMRNDADCTRILRSILPVYFADEHRTGSAYAELRSSITVTLLMGDDQAFDVRARLRTLAMPACVLVGAHDFLFGPRWAEIMIGGLPDPKVTTFERSGHFAHIEQPAEFADAVMAFASSIAAAAD